MQIEPAIAVEVRDAATGRRERRRDARRSGDIGKGHRAVVSEQPAREVLLRDEDIEVPVAVVVERRHAAARRCRRRAARRAPIDEGPVPVVLEDPDEPVGSAEKHEVEVVVPVEVRAGHAEAVLRIDDRR